MSGVPESLPDVSVITSIWPNGGSVVLYDDFLCGKHLGVALFLGHSDNRGYSALFLFSLGQYPQNN